MSYLDTVLKSFLKGYRKKRGIDSFWLRQMPHFLKIVEILNLNICYCYWDIDNLNEHQVRMINLYRKNLEFDIPVFDIDFGRY